MPDNSNTSSANPMAASQCIEAGGCGEDDLLKGSSEWGWKWIEVTLNCWSPGIFRHSTSRVSWEYMALRRETVQWVTVGGNASLMSEESGLTLLTPQRDRKCTHNHWLAIATKQRVPNKVAFEGLMCGVSSQKQNASTQKPQFKRKPNIYWICAAGTFQMGREGGPQSSSFASRGSSQRWDSRPELSEFLMPSLSQLFWSWWQGVRRITGWESMRQTWLLQPHNRIRQSPRQNVLSQSLCHTTLVQGGSITLALPLFFSNVVSSVPGNTSR